MQIPLKFPSGSPLHRGATPPNVPVRHNNQQPEHPSANVVLALGIAGLFVPLVSFAAWIIGNNVRKEEATGQYRPSSNATIGRILGMVISICTVLDVVFMLLMLIGMTSFTVS